VDSVAEPDIVTTWVHGWTLSRGVPAPKSLPFGFYIDVGLPQHRARYVLPTFSQELLVELIAKIDFSWTFIKICADPLRVSGLFPKRWTVQGARFMMTSVLTDMTDVLDDRAVSESYSSHMVSEGAVIRAELRNSDGAVIASGRGALWGSSCVFDRIETHENYRRQGLGSAIMGLLGHAAMNAGKKTGVLVATSDGLGLYRTMGWRVYSAVTSAVIVE
jgi:GNAT superfamily N-acetyltransferase